MSRGKLIVIEGTAETGKQEQAMRLQRHLGATAVFEPALSIQTAGSREFDRTMHQLLGQVADEAIDTSRLLRAARLAHCLETTVAPVLETDQTVIMTRSWLSNEVADPLYVSAMKRRKGSMQTTHGQTIKPDLTVLLLRNYPSEGAAPVIPYGSDHLTLEQRYSLHANEADDLTTIIVNTSPDMLQDRIQDTVARQLGLII
jgi:thymidylate kinase